MEWSFLCNLYDFTSRAPCSETFESVEVFFAPMWISPTPLVAKAAEIWLPIPPHPMIETDAFDRLLFIVEGDAPTL